MIVNLCKLQSIIIERSNAKTNPQSLIINSNYIETSESMELLGIEINNHLQFESQVSTICKKAAGQLNASSHLKFFLNQDQRNIIAHNFIYSNFNYCSLIWQICLQRSTTKIEYVQNRPI